MSEFVLKYLGETPPPAPPQVYPQQRTTPAPPATQAPATPPADLKKAPAAKDSKTPAPKEKDKPAAKGRVAPPGPLVTIERPTVVVAPYVRRVEAICGTGDATISVASFGGTVRLKKL